MKIETERLILIPFTLAVATGVLTGKLEVLKELGLNIDDAWPDSEGLATLPKIVKILETVPRPTGFESWLIVKRATMSVIGDAGFKGRPDSTGMVDIGYGIIAKERQTGFGFETAKALTNWAFAQPGVRAVTAQCLITNQASIGLLKKLGMREIARDDQMIYWKADNRHATGDELLTLEEDQIEQS